MTIFLFSQIPWNNLTFYPNCKVLVEQNFSYKWNSKNGDADQIVHISLIPEIAFIGRFLEFQQLELLLHFEIVQILGGLLESKTKIMCLFSPSSPPFILSFFPLYEYNSKMILGKVGFGVLCFSQLNGMDGLYDLCSLCRYY